MLRLHLHTHSDEPLRLLAIGAHPDDIEIGAGGALLTLAQVCPSLQVRYIVLTGTAERHDEARAAAGAFLSGADVSIDLHGLPEGRLPTRWGDVKDILEENAAAWTPDLIVAPSPTDAHQDHRTIAEIVPTVFRDSFSLGYEIPKWDGDLGRPTVYLPLSDAVAHRKVELLHKCFPSQAGRDWWDDDVFLGLARLRGMECRARFAEAFTCTKSILLPV